MQNSKKNKAIDEKAKLRNDDLSLTTKQHPSHAYIATKLENHPSSRKK